MLKPFLPRLEGFLRNHPELKAGEYATINLQIINDAISIQIIAISIEKNKNGKHEITRVLSDVDPQKL